MPWLQPARTEATAEGPARRSRSGFLWPTTASGLQPLLGLYPASRPSRQSRRKLSPAKEVRSLLRWLIKTSAFKFGARWTTCQLRNANLPADWAP